jgi:hypothetical protein
MSSSCETFSCSEVSTRRVAANIIMMSSQRSSRRTTQRSSRPLILLVPRRKFHPNRRRSKCTVALLPSVIILGLTHFILFFQNIQPVVALVDNDEFAMPPSVGSDRILTVTELEKQLPNVINPDIPSGQSWEDDDDDIYESVVAAADNEIPSNGADIVQVQVGEEGTGENDFSISDEKYQGYDSEWPNKIIDNEINEATSEYAIQTDEVVDAVTLEHSNDEDDDAVERLSVQSYDASVDIIPTVSETTPEKDFGPVLDGTIDVGSVPIGESASVEEIHDFTVAQSEDDDDDDDAEEEVASVEAVDTDANYGNKFGGSGLDEDSKVELPEVDNEDNDGVKDESDNRLNDNAKMSVETDDSEKFVTGATNTVAEELYGLDSLSTAYHRSQSIAGDGISGNDESPVVENEATADILRGNTDGAENAKNESNVNSLPTEGNENNITEESPNKEDPNLIPPIQGWGDAAEGSFLEMMQSTFNVLLLAAVLTSLLIFRKRVLLRLHTDPTLSMTGAVREELVNFALKIKSWVGNAAGSAVRESSATVEGRGNSLTRIDGSFRAETTPLSTAVDEEWGWGDDDVGQRLELSAMGGDKEKEDEDLALALAMSLSESHNDRDDFNSRVTPTTPLANKRLDKKSPPAKLSNSSSRLNPSTTREEKPPSSTTLGGADSIEDLLGHIGGNGGPIITSLGHKLQKTSKPNQNQQNLRSDDIFDSMGLTNYPSIAAASKPTARPVSTASGIGSKSKVTGPKIAPIQSLIAETIDADADSWGDDGDLDDLLDD